jgi:hypothetical protein
VADLGGWPPPWQLLARIEAPGIDPDDRNVLAGWEASPHQRFERLLRERGVSTGLLISERAETRDGETSGYLVFPPRPMRDVAGRPVLGGLNPPALLERSRDAQAAISTELAGQGRPARVAARSRRGRAGAGPRSRRAPAGRTP